MNATLATARAAFTEAAANRASFWTQVTAMVVNDAAWVGFWLIFFDQVGTVRGWDADRIMLLFAVLTCSVGIVLGLLANARQLGRLAADGGLDAALALPVAPLGHLLVRRVDTVNLGDSLFGVVLFVVAGQPTPARAAVFVGGVLCATAVLAGFLVTASSLAFFGGNGETGDLGVRSMLMLASYPVDIFVGAPRLVLYTAVPAAFIAAVPAGLIDELDVTDAALLATAATVAVLGGWATFTLGLRRYASGAVWTSA